MISFTEYRRLEHPLRTPLLTVLSRDRPRVRRGYTHLSHGPVATPETAGLDANATSSRLRCLQQHSDPRSRPAGKILVSTQSLHRPARETVGQSDPADQTTTPSCSRPPMLRTSCRQFMPNRLSQTCRSWHRRRTTLGWCNLWIQSTASHPGPHANNENRQISETAQP
jgi:hypothetical protein